MVVWLILDIDSYNYLKYIANDNTVYCHSINKKRN